MHEYKATIEWKNLNGPDFLKGRFSREHTWTFDGGVTIPASSSPYVRSRTLVEPGQRRSRGSVCGLPSCHMLTFVWLAGKAGFLVESYRDEATGVMAKNERGSFWVSKVTLHPQIVWGGDKTPTTEELDRLHHRSHEECFIANSVKTEVTVSTPRL